MKFSTKAFWIVTASHAFMTVFVALDSLGSVMAASPVHDPTNDVQFAENFFWIWQTGPAVLSHFFDVDGIVIVSMAFVWSLLVGAAAGFFFGRRPPNLSDRAEETTAPPSSDT